MPERGRDDAAFIFHIGHCGSTLLSRLLDDVPGVLGLREPQSLRDLATVGGLLDRPECPWAPARYGARAAMLRQLLARTFTSDQRAVVKATSFVSTIAPVLVSPAGRAILLYVTPQRYFETILAGPNSRAELASVSGPRLARLHRRIDAAPWRLWSLGEGERIALGWTTGCNACRPTCCAISRPPAEPGRAASTATGGNG